MNAFSLQTYNLSVKLSEKIGNIEKVYLQLIDSKANCGQVWNLVKIVKNFFYNFVKNLNLIGFQAFKRSSRYNLIQLDSACGHLKKSENFRLPLLQQYLSLSSVYFGENFSHQTFTFIHLLIALSLLFINFIQLLPILYSTFLTLIIFSIINLCFSHFHQLIKIQKSILSIFGFQNFLKPSFKGLRTRQYTLDLEHAPQCPSSSG